ncbi:MAG TPA: hypothetical protein VGO28_07700 [Acidimicrobiia bacterium]|jgi:hypothetical protein
MLVAEFRSPEDARAAIEALEQHGIDGGEIGVPAPPRDAPRQAVDRRTLLHISGRFGRGIAVGAVVGAVIFALIGVVFLVVGWPVAAFAGLVLAGAAIGGTTGAFIGVERGVAMSEGWEETFHEPPTGDVRLEVQTTSSAEMAKARRVLEERQPLTVYESSGADR